VTFISWRGPSVPEELSTGKRSSDRPAGGCLSQESDRSGSAQSCGATLDLARGLGAAIQARHDPLEFLGEASRDHGPHHRRPHRATGARVTFNSGFFWAIETHSEEPFNDARVWMEYIDMAC
jgi:hypothetical protein